MVKNTKTSLQNRNCVKKINTFGRASGERILWKLEWEIGKKESVGEESRAPRIGKERIAFYFLAVVGELFLE